MGAVGSNGGGVGVGVLQEGWIGKSSQKLPAEGDSIKVGGGAKTPPCMGALSVGLGVGVGVGVVDCCSKTPPCGKPVISSPANVMVGP